MKRRKCYKRYLSTFEFIVVVGLCGANGFNFVAGFFLTQLPHMCVLGSVISLMQIRYGNLRVKCLRLGL